MEDDNCQHAAGPRAKEDNTPKLNSCHAFMLLRQRRQTLLKKPIMSYKRQRNPTNESNTKRGASHTGQCSGKSECGLGLGTFERLRQVSVSNLWGNTSRKKRKCIIALNAVVMVVAAAPAPTGPFVHVITSKTCICDDDGFLSC